MKAQSFGFAGAQLQHKLFQVMAAVRETVFGFGSADRGARGDFPAKVSYTKIMKSNKPLGIRFPARRPKLLYIHDDSEQTQPVRLIERLAVIQNIEKIVYAHR